MSERVVSIAGAGGGMARLCAQCLLSQGWSVAARDVDVRGLDVLGEHRKLLKQVVDVRDEQAGVSAVARTHGEFGDITRVVTVAAIVPFALLMETESETVRRIFDINFIGLVHVCKAMVPGRHCCVFELGELRNECRLMVMPHEKRDAGIIGLQSGWRRYSV